MMNEIAMECISKWVNQYMDEGISLAACSEFWHLNEGTVT